MVASLFFYGYGNDCFFMTAPAQTEEQKMCSFMVIVMTGRWSGQAEECPNAHTYIRSILSLPAASVLPGTLKNEELYGFYHHVSKRVFFTVSKSLLTSSGITHLLLQHEAHQHPCPRLRPSGWHRQSCLCYAIAHGMTAK